MEKHLIIKNFGPINNADIRLGSVNVIIGLQSSGKSCVLKTACYCSWVEKRLELTQKINGFGKDSTFIDIMADYYKMVNYVHADTYIEYETSHLWFAYDNAEKKFSMKWKGSRWNYRRPKVSYIPADRNLVASIPGWSGIELDGNMLEFMSEWDKARKVVKNEENFLNLGMTYSYDALTNTDYVRLLNGTPLQLRESSSGIQSLLPLYVHLDYLTSWVYNDKQVKSSYEQREDKKNLISQIYKKLFQKKQENEKPYTVSIDGYDYYFSDPKQAQRFYGIYQRFIQINHAEIFLEEPEDNLFPPTQCQLINWLSDTRQIHNDMLFIATHSPYVLSQMIKMNPKELQVLFTHPISENSRMYNVRQLTDTEVHETYENGVDMFFNFELYV